MWAFAPVFLHATHSVAEPGPTPSPWSIFFLRHKTKTKVQLHSLKIGVFCSIKLILLLFKGVVLGGNLFVRYRVIQRECKLHKGRFQNSKPLNFGNCPNLGWPPSLPLTLDALRWFLLLLLFWAPHALKHILYNIGDLTPVPVVC